MLLHTDVLKRWEKHVISSDKSSPIEKAPNNLSKYEGAVANYTQWAGNHSYRIVLSI